MADGSHLWQALSDTIQRAVNLRIVTLMGDSQVRGERLRTCRFLR
jgi:hypothetical protein